MILLPIMAGAAMALAGITLAPSRALAADVVCTPNASGVALALAFTNCAGPGDGINFPSQTAANSLVTLESLNISGGAAYGVTINTSGNNINVLDAIFSGNITTATAGSDGVNIVGGGGSINLNLTNTATGVRISAVNNGINLNTGGAGTLTVATLANVTGGNNGIISTAGAGNTTMSVRNVTGTAGRGIFAVTSGAGNINLTTLGNVSGALEGVRATTAGTGNLTLNVNAGSNVTGNVAVHLQTTGAGSVTVLNSGNISGLAGNGIEAFGNTNASLNVTSSGGSVSATGHAIFASQTNIAGSGVVNITAGGTITGGASGGNGNGILGVSQGIGNVNIATLDNAIVSGFGEVFSSLTEPGAIVGMTFASSGNTSVGSVFITLGNSTAVSFVNSGNADGVGVFAEGAGATSQASIVVGRNSTISLTGPGNEAIGIAAKTTSDFSALTTGNVTITLNNSDTPHTAVSVISDLGVGIMGNSDLTGSVNINTGANNAIVVTGDANTGIKATTGGSGNVFVTTGANSTITLNGGDGVIPSGEDDTNIGIAATSENGGNITVSTGAAVTNARSRKV